VSSAQRKKKKKKEKRLLIPNFFFFTFFIFILFIIVVKVELQLHFILFDREFQNVPFSCEKANDSINQRNVINNEKVK
jgi:hypothetical protein